MSLPAETDAARLLREMRERDAVFKALAPGGGPKLARKPFADVRATVGGLTQPLLQGVTRKDQGAPGQQAIELARQLTRTAVAVADTGEEPKNVPASASIRTVSDLGAMIRKARKGMKLTQAAFAAHAGVGRRFISELESGKGSLEIDKVIVCAMAAGIDISARSRTL